jgi:hypothetical protein
LSGGDRLIGVVRDRGPTDGPAVPGTFRGYELRHHELGYRRAFHRHDTASFVRLYDVATHEHCEPTIGLATCEHYYGEPIADAFDGFERPYGHWLADRTPDCSLLRCLG